MITPDELTAEINRRYPDVKLDIHEQSIGRIIKVGLICIPRIQQGMGIGRHIMNRLIEYADKNNKILVLSPTKFDKSSSMRKLVKWYTSLGFVWNRGRNKSFMIRDTMYRKPKTK